LAGVLLAASSPAPIGFMMPKSSHAILRSVRTMAMVLGDPQLRGLDLRPLATGAALL